jgi:hypothetical protein
MEATYSWEAAGVRLASLYRRLLTDDALEPKPPPRARRRSPAAVAVEGGA